MGGRGPSQEGSNPKNNARYPINHFNNSIIRHPEARFGGRGPLIYHAFYTKRFKRPAYRT